MSKSFYISNTIHKTFECSKIISKNFLSKDVVPPYLQRQTWNYTIWKRMYLSYSCFLLHMALDETFLYIFICKISIPIMAPLVLNKLKPKFHKLRILSSIGIWNYIHVISKTEEVSYTMIMRSKKPIAALSSSLNSPSVNSSIESVHSSSYNWPNFSASLVGRLSSFKSAISGLLLVNLDPAILVSLNWKK